MWMPMILSLYPTFILTELELEEAVDAVPSDFQLKKEDPRRRRAWNS